VLSRAEKFGNISRRLRVTVLARENTFHATPDFEVGTKSVAAANGDPESGL
jgi:hypothetical protein